MEYSNLNTEKREHASFVQGAFWVACYVIILVGGVLATYNFAFNRSLWHDEAALARNIINRDVIDLFRPLDHGQVAPIGFLLIEKLSVIVFGQNEFALRLFPLTSFFVSIPIFYLFAGKLSKNNDVAIISAAIFSINYFLLQYSSELKQYSVDVLAALLILYVSVTKNWQRSSSLFIYAGIGSLLVWFSNTSVLILFVSGVYILYNEGYYHKNYKICLPIISWIVSFGVYYSLFIHEHPLKNYMQEYWQWSFLPMTPLSVDFYTFLGTKVVKELHILLGFGPFWCIPCLVSVGTIIMLVRQRSYALLYYCLFPVFIHLLLSGIKLYPFSMRFILYVTPMMILIFSIGLYSLFQ